MNQSPYADEAAAAAAIGITELPRRPYFEPPPEEPASQAEPEPQQAPQPAPEPAKEPVKESIPEFDPKHRQPFIGLLYVGALTDTFELFGHTFVISTPTQTEMLQMGQVIEPFAMTPSADIAYQTARVAAYLVSIDGQKLPEPVVMNPKETALHDRFRWVAENLRRPVIDKVFDQCLDLEDKVTGALEAMGKASG